MILITEVGRNQYEKARKLNSPVVVCDRLTFRLPSSRPGERDHKIQLDDAELPRAYSCTCEAGLMESPCWAIARVLEALTALHAANVYVYRDASTVRAALDDCEGALTRTAAAGFGEGGELVLNWRGLQPEPQTLISLAD